MKVDNKINIYNN